MNQSAKKLVFAACCLGMMTVSFATSGPAICLTAVGADLGMDHAQQGLFVSAAFWGLTLAILVSGPLADRWGMRALLAASAVFQAIGLALVSLAGTKSAAVGGGFVLGIGTGMADALFTPLVCALYPDRRTRVTNLLHAFYAIGLIASVGLILWLSAWGWTWRPIFKALAVLALPYGLAFVFLPLPGQSHEGPHRLRARRLVRQGAFWLLAGAIFAAGLTELGASGWLPAFVQEATAASLGQGGLGLLLFGVTMAAGRLGGSALVHRLGARRLFIVGGLACAVSLLLAAQPTESGAPAWLTQRLGFPPAYWPIFWLTLLGLGVAGFWPTIMGTAGDRYPQAGASMYALLAAAGNFGASVGPVAVGLVADRAGLRWAMGLLAIAPLVTLTLMAWLLRRSRGSPSVRPRVERPQDASC